MINWTENRLERVKLLHKEGHSATVIARKLGAAFSKGIILRKLREFEAQRLHRAEMRAARKAAKARELAQIKRAAAPSVKTKVTVAAVAATAPPAPTPSLRLATGRPVKMISGTSPMSFSAKAGVTLFDLRAEQCRWPVDNDRPARLFCGSPTVGTTSWCEHHQRLAFAGLGRPLKWEDRRRA